MALRPLSTHGLISHVAAIHALVGFCQVQAIDSDTHGRRGLGRDPRAVKTKCSQRLRVRITAVQLQGAAIVPWVIIAKRDMIVIRRPKARTCPPVPNSGQVAHLHSGSVVRDEREVHRCIRVSLAIVRLDLQELGLLRGRHDQSIDRLASSRLKEGIRVVGIIDLHQRIGFLAIGLGLNARIAGACWGGPRARIRSVGGCDIPLDDGEVGLRGNSGFDITIAVGIRHWEGGKTRATVHPPVQRRRGAGRFIFQSCRDHDRVRRARHLRLLFHVFNQWRDVRAGQGIGGSGRAAVRRAGTPVLAIARAENRIAQLERTAASIRSRFPIPAAMPKIRFAAHSCRPVAFVGVIARPRRSPHFDQIVRRARPTRSVDRSIRR